MSEPPVSAVTLAVGTRETAIGTFHPPDGFCVAVDDIATRALQEAPARLLDRLRYLGMELLDPLHVAVAGEESAAGAIERGLAELAGLQTWRFGRDLHGSLQVVARGAKPGELRLLGGCGALARSSPPLIVVTVADTVAVDAVRTAAGETVFEPGVVLASRARAPILGAVRAQAERLGASFRVYFTGHEAEHDCVYTDLRHELEAYRPLFWTCLANMGLIFALAEAAPDVRDGP